MSTEARTIGVSGRPTLWTFWTATVSVLAVTALILSGLALTVAAPSDRSATGAGSSVGQAAATVGSPRWDAGKLHAMELRMDLAEAAPAPGSAALWDAGKLHAMELRMDLAEAA